MTSRTRAVHQQLGLMDWKFASPPSCDQDIVLSRLEETNESGLGFIHNSLPSHYSTPMTREAFSGGSSSCILNRVRSSRKNLGASSGKKKGCPTKK